MIGAMWLDVVVLSLLALFAFLGARRGGLAAGLGLLTLLVSYAAAVFAAPRFGAGAAETFDVPPLLGMPIAGSIAFLVAFVLMSLASKGLKRLEANHPGRSARDRFFGGFFGLVRGSMVVLALSYLAIWVDALRTTGTAPDLPAIGPSAAASVTESVVEAGVGAAFGESGSARLMARVAARPGETIVELQELMENPVLVDLRTDEMFWTYVEYGSIDAAMNRRGFLALSYDRDMRETLGKLGLIGPEAVEEAEVFRDQARGMLSKLGPPLHNLKTDPQMQELMQDPQVIEAVQAGDHLALMTDPRFRQVVARVMDDVEMP